MHLRFEFISTDAYVQLQQLNIMLNADIFLRELCLYDVQPQA